MTKKYHDFRIQVDIPVDDDKTHMMLRSHQGFKSDYVSVVGVVRTVVFEGTWQNMKHLAQTLENRHDLQPMIVYQGKYAMESLT